MPDLDAQLPQDQDREDQETADRLAQAAAESSRRQQQQELDQQKQAENDAAQSLQALEAEAQSTEQNQRYIANGAAVAALAAEEGRIERDLNWAELAQQAPAEQEDLSSARQKLEEIRQQFGRDRDQSQSQNQQQGRSR